MRLESERVRAFANASGDHNPLHVDPDFARRSPCGTTIAHGGLLVIAALGRLTDNELDSLSSGSVDRSTPAAARRLT